MKNLIIAILLLALLAGCAKDTDDNWGGPVIPASITGIEVVNIDNAGEFPAITAAAVKKEAYMIGVRWITDNKPTEGDDKFITDPIREGQYPYYYGSASSGYTKAILCLTDFRAGIPAGTYVSKFFKEIDRNYLPADVDEGFVLLEAPAPGVHAFRVEYYGGDGELKFFHETTPIEFF
jgi:hypothetical protein